MASLQKRALNLIDNETVKTARAVGHSHSVFFLGIELGQIRPLYGSWGWRLPTGDRKFPSKQAAAIAFTEWVLRRHWVNYKSKIEEKLENVQLGV